MPLALRSQDDQLIKYLKLQKQTLSSSSEHTPSPTHTSQTAHAYPLILDPSIPLGRNRYRSANDPSVSSTRAIGTQYIVLDTPGHGKLRPSVSLSTANISSTALSGILFVIDASALDSSSYLSDAAGYLHDTLLALLRRRRLKTLSKQAKSKSIPVLIAANKQDLFTALPQGSVRERLEQEIERIRDSRRRGVVAVEEKDEGDLGVDDDDFEMLGSGGEQKFTFAALEDEDNGPGLRVEVLGGSVRGEEAGKGVQRWQEWIGDCL